jgi:hypothetical protein
VSIEPCIREIAAAFDVPGEPMAAELFGGGHINDSYRLTFAVRGASRRYLLQRINSAIFRDPPRLMENVQRVTAHIAARLRDSGVQDTDRRVLRVVPARGGLPYQRDEAGGYWRMYHFVEGTAAREAPESPAQAEQAGRAFGEFQRLLADFPAPRLHDTIPDFHNTPLRFAALEQAVRADVCGRGAAARAEIEFAFRNRALGRLLVDAQARGELPERVVHNDAKLSNVLLDAVTGEGLCVVDLDIVMPGLAVYDLGDMVRSMTCAAAEDETDLPKVEVQVPLFEGLARGYLATAGAFLMPAERALLVAAGKVITLEQGVRFLADFVAGDTYYKTSRPLQNLDRCRTQFKLLESFARHEAEMERTIAHL